MFMAVLTPLFQSTPPAKGATADDAVNSQLLVISIHAPREGGDETVNRNRELSGISIHAPREGGD